MTFTNEAEFEKALIKVLRDKGWGEHDVIKNPTEEQLLENWAKILFENNKSIDRLNNIPLTHSEMQQILEQINILKTPLKLNSFINGRTVSIVRDNEEDKLHFGKEISLKIYDRAEIAAGQSRYQIVQQPIFKTKSKILNDRRGDLMLLINGMPVIHIELKKSGVPVSQAYNQIEKYSREGVFTGLFSLVQVFVAMEPEESVYFANPGMDGKFNKDYYFHWADFNNEPINDWKKVASLLLSIPMAHQLIGYYTVADDADGVLKVMRSYQYYAANAISDKIKKTNWKDKNSLGGYIWHTTGSGKTMTSFKSAQLIANSKDADKVIFLMDRIELGTQSLQEYRAFADASDDVQATENTGVLITKLKSNDPANTLIVTSIQKMSNINSEEDGLKSKDIELISNKRIVFIVDEAHRSTFGDMLITIKDTFTNAIFFGFTGTPIQDENQKKDNTTATVFGDELHRYSIADGIRDKNVLGFDPYKVLTYRDKDLRKAVALQESKAKSEVEALNDEKKKKVFNKFMTELKMTGYTDASGKYIKGIEDFVSKAQYERIEHQNQVINDILDNWITLSQNFKFHAIFATSSIPEAIEYYRLLKVKIQEKKLDLKFTALFDSNIDNDDGAKSAFKEDGIVEIMEDYNKRYEQDFSLKIFQKFKKDIASRLAHKKPYNYIERNPEKQIDLLIVVDQMLTGFDSKWINTLYLDKVIKYETIIQAFSRTNRLFGADKPFGTIRYYRFPHTMEENINKAVKLYSGDKPLGLFADRLENNLVKLNKLYDEIFDLFKSAGIENFEKLPDDLTEKAEFAKLFKKFNETLEASKIQGFKWSELEYEFKEPEPKRVVNLNIDENTYLILVQRYKELPSSGGGSGGNTDIPFEIEGYITEIDTDKIDTDFMNSRFDKYRKIIDSGDTVEIEKTLNELHKSFATLSQEEQKYANIFIHDIQNGDIQIDSNKTFREYVAQYQANAENSQIMKLVELFGLNSDKLKEMLNSNVTDLNINDYGRFDELKNSVDKEKAKVYFEEIEGCKLPIPKVNIKVHKLLKDFILSGGYEIKS
ncbi:type I restriction endonuclease subunit R [Aliarcobacter butzleri]|uniref:type I restriction endonuclease subunit R n=1 Tax=Aliarcobacter butzleri TaxID=28197 RepID=UPI001EDBB336|nr:HsdR family type I site-specific deoxyribonuclease [Aliarcobacter butzleri]MCG3710943.1 HsdR family type I site-specific deoxyribonuclease [Aliarcobacter butzleri]MCG3714294.1 HsdR family type I site-specific deoxyribonuclease [Aliarcobacter butzleri]